MNPRRTFLNVITFVALSTFLLYYGLTKFIFPPEPGQTVIMTAPDAAGLLPRSDVTVRGVPSGDVRAVRLTDQGTTEVTIALDPGVVITEGTSAQITRRSPIGDITVELTPGQGAPLPDGGRIPIEAVTTPPDPVRTIEVLSNTLQALTPEDVGTVVEELATAVRGRGQDLATLSEAGADLPEKILEVRVQLESLINTGPKVLDVLAANAPTLADDFVLTAMLADILRDRRFDLVELSKNGANFADVFGELLARQKPNLACLINDFGEINATLAGGENLQNLESVLDLNHFFFDAVWESVQTGKDGYGWFRVHFLPPQEPHGQSYQPKRAPPDVFGGHGCHNQYGKGVGPADQASEPYVAPGSQLHPGT